MSAHTATVALLDFDRPGVDAQDTVSLAMEMTRHVSVQFPQGDQILREARERVRGMVTAQLEHRRGRSSASDSQEDRGSTYENLVHPGAVGAQQAMLDPSVSTGLANLPPILPWVPDLVGEEWMHECGIVIVGQNYGQFIAGYTKRTKRMRAYDYASAITWQAFQKAFINDVVIDDNDYYELLAPLLRTTKSNARFILTDLVRNTLVRRGTPKRRAGTVQRIDRNIDLNDVEHCKVYGSYADGCVAKT